MLTLRATAWACHVHDEHVIIGLFFGLRPLPPAPFVRRPHRDSKTVGRKARNSAGRQAKRRNGIHGKRVCHGTKVVQGWDFCMGLGCSRSGTAAWIGGPRIHCGYHASGYVHMYSPHSFTSGHGAMGMTLVHDDGILPPRAVRVLHTIYYILHTTYYLRPVRGMLQRLLAPEQASQEGGGVFLRSAAPA